ncbi:hypothetical protein FVE85_0504 [Porphyridium purpureum]|uniref:C2 NT-type domain-containing protein n=1 Tax=Porphyridium purpureum TaxID=35688 RepID=A0A5J4Z034_PORPP|nr:hypothetical protein FVE85_0504 [Porphyridium purpureum]|eukprot:POR0533..scf208_2
MGQGRGSRHFGVKLSVVLLDHVPLGHSMFVASWMHVRRGASAAAKPEHGETGARLAKNNQVVWNETFNFTVRISSPSTDPHQLERSLVSVDINEYERQNASKAMPFGTVQFDLSEFAGIGNVTRTFLLRDCRLNSMLRIELVIKLTYGDRIFRRTSSAVSRAGQGSKLIADTVDDFSADSEGVGDDNAGLLSDLTHGTGSVRAGNTIDLIHRNATKRKSVADALEKLPTRGEALMKERYELYTRKQYPEYVERSRIDARSSVELLLDSVNLLEYEDRARATDKAKLDLRTLVGTKTASAGRSISNRQLGEGITDRLKSRKFTGMPRETRSLKHRASSLSGGDVLDTSGSFRSTASGLFFGDELFLSGRSDSQDEVPDIAEDKDKAYLDVGMIQERYSTRGEVKKNANKNISDWKRADAQQPSILINFAEKAQQKRNRALEERESNAESASEAEHMMNRNDSRNTNDSVPELDLSNTFEAYGGVGFSSASGIETSGIVGSTPRSRRSRMKSKLRAKSMKDLTQGSADEASTYDEMSGVAKLAPPLNETVRSARSRTMSRARSQGSKDLSHFVTDEPDDGWAAGQVLLNKPRSRAESRNRAASRRNRDGVKGVHELPLDADSFVPSGVESEKRTSIWSKPRAKSTRALEALAIDAGAPDIASSFEDGAVRES